MAFISPMTAVTGATYTAAQFNTNVRDNLNAIWVGTTAGDMEYYTSNSSKARVALGAAATVLTSNGSAPGWSAAPAISGLYKTADLATFSPDADYSTTSFSDVAGASVTLTLPAGKTYTVIVIAVVQAYNTFAGSGHLAQLQAVIGGTAGGAHGTNGSESTPRNEGQTVMSIKQGVASGSCVCKLQAKKDTNATHVTEGHLMAFAFAE